MAPSLPPDFGFSQGSLQDYVDCPRRFWLRYLRRLAWPAIQAEPVADAEMQMLRGEWYHRLVQQHGLGISATRLERAAAAIDEMLETGIASAANAGDDAAQGGNLVTWWRNYLASPPPDLPTGGPRELTLATTVAGRRLTAKYDLVAADPGRRAVIVDWKTGRLRSARPRLAARLQTRVYRYVLVEAGGDLNEGLRWRPEQVSMVYWFANTPDKPEIFPYDTAQYRADGRYLAGLVGEIVARPAEEPFAMTGETARCAYCVYRSLCDRGREAGDLMEVETLDPGTSSLGEDFDFGQIAEIEF